MRHTVIILDSGAQSGDALVLDLCWFVMVAPRACIDDISDNRYGPPCPAPIASITDRCYTNISNNRMDIFVTLHFNTLS